MNIMLSRKLSAKKGIYRYYFEWGKGAGQRKATGIFTYATPANSIHRNHNKEALALLETKRSELILERQSLGSSYRPAHKLKYNFLDYYQQYVQEHRRSASRHLQSSLTHFRSFLNREFISAKDISEDLCLGFRSYLLKRYNGETPANYFSEFKRMMKAARKAGYFIEDPAEDIKCKTSPVKRRKPVIEPEEYIQLLNTVCPNIEVRRAFVVSMYQGLRWCDVKPLRWESVFDDKLLLKQSKTGVPVELALHPLVKLMLGERGKGVIFRLPTADGANKILKQWAQAAGIQKNITWHCARLSFSVLLQDEGVELATVAGMLGHTSLRYVEQVYQRFRFHRSQHAILKLPNFPGMFPQSNLQSTGAPETEV